MASSPGGGGPVYEVLSSFLPKRVMTGRAPFVAADVTEQMGSAVLEALILELDALTGRVTGRPSRI
jgi:hypothetical protein